MIKIGLIKEGKTPPDKRVALSPGQCKELMHAYPKLQIFCQPSETRCFKDHEYVKNQISLQSGLNHCDYLFGIKEVPIQQLIEKKTYFFFSHTIKKQAHNQKLLQAILEKKITLIDYECLTDKNGNRLVAFGKYAGIVGAYNGVLTYGKRYGLYNLKKACDCFDMEDIKEELKKVKLPPIKICVTGFGRVAKGAMAILDELRIKSVEPIDYLNNTYEEPVYTVLRSSDYNESIDGSAYDSLRFYKNPSSFRSTFLKFGSRTDLLIAAAFWNPSAPKLFSLLDAKNPSFKIRVIADITCDLNGSIPTTIRPSTIPHPVYDFDPLSQEERRAFSDPRHITVMAIDNLPCELPRDASFYFGKQLMDHVFPYLSGDDPDRIIERGTIVKNGELTENFRYLEDYAKSK